MAEFHCRCGKVLENSRRGDELHIFLEKEVLAACQQVNGISLSDFLVSWRRFSLRDNTDVVYWRCPDCGTIYEASPSEDGGVFRTFEKVDRQDEVVLNALGPFDRVFVLDADFVADWEEQAGSQTLFDAIYQTRWENDYFTDPDRKMLLALKATTNMSAFVYEDIDKRA